MIGKGSDYQGAALSDYQGAAGLEVCILPAQLALIRSSQAPPYLPKGKGGYANGDFQGQKTSGLWVFFKFMEGTSNLLS